MASWAVLLALSGYKYDGVSHFIAFSPKIHQYNFYTFWSTGNGWGSFKVKNDKVKIKMEYGSLKISKLGISQDYEFKSIQSIQINSKKIKAKLSRDKNLSIVNLDRTAELKRGDELVIIFKKNPD
ncbi:MAG: hypothetical protein HQ555_05085 [Candidatus Aminicenantes bacterium]|nr:hypothetical protein [Candidatus Aminicenantes bacterium]